VLAQRATVLMVTCAISVPSGTLGLEDPIGGILRQDEIG